LFDPRLLPGWPDPANNREVEMFEPSNLRRVGWILFGAMWIPFATIFIGVIGMPDGSYDWIELPALARYSISLVLALGGTSTLLLVGAPILSGLRNRSLRREGLPARAKVINIWDTGTTINENPVVGLRLEVQPPGGSVFEAETEQLISRLLIPSIQPGMEVEVRYHPINDEVALVLE
jgi:hypothetical protein